MNAIRLGGQVLAVLLSAGVALPTWAGSEAETTSAAPVQAIRAVDPYFAKVDGKIITIRDYRDVYNATMRKRYYHAKPPEDEADAVRKEIADILIVRELVIGDAERNGIQPQEENIKLIMANTDASYSAKPEWQRQRERLLSELKTQLTRKSLYEQNEKKLHEVPAPSKEEVRAYYEKRPDLFTEPARQRLSVILLKVDPGAPKQDWESAVAKEKEIYQRIKDGASFAEMAKQYSAHASAKMGGDMGYVHRGMLPDQLQE
ncbi:MAG: peptidylprolyl isomerase, partial [Gammaproteobacteria bacterium]|nr:peptidylprolyl isomerase [Gammaproteobacteria bacterium]